MARRPVHWPHAGLGGSEFDTIDQRHIRIICH